MVANGGEDIQHLMFVCGCVTHTVGCHQRKMKRTGNPNCRLVAPFFFALLMSLELDVNILLAKDRDQPLDDFNSCLLATIDKRGGEWAFVAACETDEPLGVLFEVFEGRC